jgi:hypothetical protein
MSESPAEPTSPTAPPAEVVSPDGVASAMDGATVDEVADIESPAKIIRIGAMVRQLLEEVRNTGLDDAARDRLKGIYTNSLLELKGALSPELGDELDRLSLDFSAEAVPTDAELRIAQAQLVGWLEGLFHGIQATLVAQQMSRQAIEGMRGQLPERSMGGPGGPGYI